MFIVETSRPSKKHWLWLAAFILVGGVGLTMHWTVKPSPKVPPGLRIFGFPRPKPERLAPL